MAAKQTWLDEKAQTPQIDAYVQKLGTFMQAMADGRIDDRELSEQEKRLDGGDQRSRAGAERRAARPGDEAAVRADGLQRHADAELAAERTAEEQVCG